MDVDEDDLNTYPNHPETTRLYDAWLLTNDYPKLNVPFAVMVQEAIANYANELHTYEDVFQIYHTKIKRCESHKN